MTLPGYRRLARLACVRLSMPRAEGYSHSWRVPKVKSRRTAGALETFPSLLCSWDLSKRKRNLKLERISHGTRIPTVLARTPHVTRPVAYLPHVSK